MTTRLRQTAFILLILPLLASTPAQAALTAEDEASIEQVRKETADLMKSVKSYGAAQRDEAIQEIEIAIIKLDNRIDALQERIDARWDSMTGAARQDARASLKALQKQRVELARWYGNLETSSASAWDDIKRGFSRAYSDINKAWAKAIDEFYGGES